MSHTERLRAYNHVDYRRNSQLIRSLFGGFCVFHSRDCGDIQIHHNDRNNKNNNITNLVPVCKDGHRLIHLTNWRYDNMKELFVERLRYMVSCFEAGKSF